MDDLKLGPHARRPAVRMAIAVGCVASVVMAIALALQIGWLREPVIRLLAKRADRQIQVNGPFRFELFARYPRIVADGVVIGNPPWMPAGTAATVGRMILEVQWSSLTGPLTIRSLVLERASLQLLRNPAGQANWQWRDSLQGASGTVPLIHALSMRDARLSLIDERRRLRFNGLVSVDDRADPAGALPLRLTAIGELNTRATAIEINGASLATASRDSPYAFSFSEQSNGSQIGGRAALRRPFSLDEMAGTVEGSGANLKDLYFLTGVSLINTGAFRLAAAFDRRGDLFTYKDIVLTFGQSDVRGTVSVDTTDVRPQFTAMLESRRLRFADTGVRATPDATASQKDPPLLLPTAAFNRESMLRLDGVLKYRAGAVEVSRYSLSDVEANGRLKSGVLTMESMSATLLRGKARAAVTIDARPEVPVVDIDATMSALQLNGLIREASGDAPVEGSMTARLRVRGKGTSVHQVAASAAGEVTAVIPRGEVRAAFAELTGIDLRALGMLLSKQHRTTPIRCGVASFQAREGILTAQQLVLDTEDVLVTGEGRIRMDTEALELRIAGHPKRVRLVRVRSPLMVQGTLKHPTIGIQGRNSAGQAAGAVALGLVLTPLASMLAFVDPGLTKDADCATLLATTRRQP